MKVLITGANGQLGSDLKLLLSSQRGFEVIALSHNDLDVTDHERVSSRIAEVQPHVILHTAAFTAVDACESDADAAFRVNAIGTRNVAVAANKVGAKLTYISTDYVFDGTKEGPYREYDAPNPINVYGRSKLIGEQYVRDHANEFFIIRTAWLYGRQGKNFVKTVLQLARERDKPQIVNDQRGSPTCTTDLAKQMLELMSTKLYGTYHCTSQGECTWYEFACEIFRLADLEVPVKPVSTEEFPRPAPRPKNSVLDNYLLRLQDLDVMPPWQEALERFLRRHRTEELIAA